MPPVTEASADDSASVDERLSILLGQVSRPQTTLAPSERRLALDALGVLLPRASRALHEQIGRRLCLMENPPRALVLAALRLLPQEDVLQILEEARLPDDLLVEMVETGDPPRLDSIVRRRRLSPVVCTALAQHAPHHVLAAMLRNDGAEMVESVWWKLLERAPGQPALQQALAERTDLPAPVGHELFWHMSSRLRQRLLGRQAGTSTSMEELLKLAGMPQTASQTAFMTRLWEALALLQEDRRDDAARLLAAVLGVHDRTIGRILRDDSGEAFAIMTKCGHMHSHAFGEILDILAATPLLRIWPFLTERERLQDFYAAMGTTNARVILLYWDWRSRCMGPYATLPPLED